MELLGGTGPSAVGSGTGCVQHRVSVDGFFIDKCGDSRSIAIYTALKKKKKKLDLGFI